MLGLVVGYPAFAFGGYFLIGLVSANRYDPSVEASMTAAFVIGPVGALIGLVAGVVLGGRKRAEVEK